MTLANLMTLVLIFEAGVVFVVSLRLWRFTHWWVDLAFALAFFLWVVLYLWVLFIEPTGYDPVWFGRVFIRPLNIFTFGLLGAVTYWRLRNVPPR